MSSVVRMSTSKHQGIEGASIISYTYIASVYIYNGAVGVLRIRVAEARARLSLTQAQAAELLATSQANISAYERGRLQPGRLVSERIKALAALQPDSVYATYSASTIPSAAAQIRTDLATNRSETDMLRVVIQASDDFHKLNQQADRAFFLTEPSPTGSREWDALIAGLAVHLCREARMDRAPMWTTDPTRILDSVWWVDSAAPAARAQLLQQAIPAMRARGVMMSRRNLESV